MSIELDPAATGNGVTGPSVETRSGGVRRFEVDFDRVIELAAEAMFEAVDLASGAGYPASGASLVNDDQTLVIDVLPDRSGRERRGLGGRCGLPGPRAGG